MRGSRSLSVSCEQGCEPKTESQFFRSFFSVFLQPKTDFLKKSVFRLPKKTKPKNRLGFFGRFFYVPYVKNAYVYVRKPRYGWTRRPLRHTAAAAAQQQRSSSSNSSSSAPRDCERHVSSDGRAAFEPEAEAGAGKRVVEVESSDDAVKVVSKPLGGRVAASKAAAVFVTCKQSSYTVEEPRLASQCRQGASSVPILRHVRTVELAVHIIHSI